MWIGAYVPGSLLICYNHEHDTPVLSPPMVVSCVESRKIMVRLTCFIITMLRVDANRRKRKERSTFIVSL